MSTIIAVMAGLYIWVAGPLQLWSLGQKIYLAWKKQQHFGYQYSRNMGVLNIGAIFYGLQVDDWRFVLFSALAVILYITHYLVCRRVVIKSTSKDE